METKQRVGNRFHSIFHCFLWKKISEAGLLPIGYLLVEFLERRFDFLSRALFLDLLRTDRTAMRVLCWQFFVYISMYTLYTILLIILATLSTHMEKVLPINTWVPEEAIGAHSGYRCH